MRRIDDSTTASRKLPLRSRFGAALKDARLARGMTQDQLGTICAMPRSYVSAIEHGHKTVTIETADLLASAVGLKLSQLIERAELIHGSSH